MFAGPYIMRPHSTGDISSAASVSARHHPTFPRLNTFKHLVSLSLCLAFSSPLALANDRFDNLIADIAGASFEAEIPQARGVLKAGDEAIIASGMSGRLTKAPYKTGQIFKRGSLLAQFDCTQETAELTALTQAHETLSLRYQNQEQLFQAGAAGALDVSVARSEMQQAAAERDALKARLGKCRVYAPYAGIVAEKHIAAYETPALNAPLYTIHRAGTPDISIIIPSKWLRHVDTGTRFDFTVDETGHVLSGKVSRIGAAVDPVSQTIEITGKITKPAKRALSGMSGVARFETKYKS